MMTPSRYDDGAVTLRYRLRRHGRIEQHRQQHLRHPHRSGAAVAAEDGRDVTRQRGDDLRRGPRLHRHHPHRHRHLPARRPRHQRLEARQEDGGWVSRRLRHHDRLRLPLQSQRVRRHQPAAVSEEDEGRSDEVTTVW